MTNQRSTNRLNRQQVLTTDLVDRAEDFQSILYSYPEMKKQLSLTSTKTPTLREDLPRVDRFPSYDIQARLLAAFAYGLIAALLVAGIWMSPAFTR